MKKSNEVSNCYSNKKKKKISMILLLVLTAALLGGCADKTDYTGVLDAEHEQTTDIMQEVTTAATPTEIPVTDAAAESTADPMTVLVSKYQSSVLDIFEQYDETEYLVSDYESMTALYQDTYDQLSMIKSDEEGQTIVSDFIEKIIEYDNKKVTALESAEDILNAAFHAYDAALYTAGAYLRIESIYSDAKSALADADETEYDSIIQTGIEEMSQISVSSIEKTITTEQFETRRQEIINTLSSKNMSDENITAMLLIFNIDSLTDETFLNYYDPDSTYNDYCVGIEALRIRYRTVMRQTKPENLNYLFDLAQFIFNENDLTAVENMDRMLMECTNGYRETISKNIKDFVAFYEEKDSSFTTKLFSLSDGGNLALNSIGYPFVNSFMGDSDIMTEEESMEFYSCVEPYLYENNFLKDRYSKITAAN